MAAGRNRENYFPREDGAPSPLRVEVSRRIGFGEADMMGVTWFGNYPRFFEEGSAALGRLCGLTYQAYFLSGMRAPIVKCHIDYRVPLVVDEVFTIRAEMIWCESARINTEYHLLKKDGSVATRGYTSQVFMDANGEICLVTPPLLAGMRERWKKGEIR